MRPSGQPFSHDADHKRHVKAGAQKPDLPRKEWTVGDMLFLCPSPDVALSLDGADPQSPGDVIRFAQRTADRDTLSAAKVLVIRSR